jgi:hypothetical protein
MKSQESLILSIYLAGHLDEDGIVHALSSLDGSCSVQFLEQLTIECCRKRHLSALRTCLSISCIVLPDATIEQCIEMCIAQKQPNAAKVVVTSLCSNIRALDDALMRLLRWICSQPNDTSSQAFSGMLSMLLDHNLVDVSASDNIAFFMACQSGNLEFVQRLLCDARVDPSASLNRALCSACARNHAAIVKYLLDDARVDPSEPSEAPIREAVAHRSYSAISALLEDGRVDPTPHGFEIICTMILEGKYVPDLIRTLLFDGRIAFSNAELSRIIKLLLDMHIGQDMDTCNGRVT